MRDDLVKILRGQGKDAFAKHYSLGMYKICVDAADEIERLRAKLDRARKALEQAQDCIRGETPEGISEEDARADTASKIRAVLSDD